MSRYRHHQTFQRTGQENHPCPFLAALLDLLSPLLRNSLLNSFLKTLSRISPQISRLQPLEISLIPFEDGIGPLFWMIQKIAKKMPSLLDADDATLQKIKRKDSLRRNPWNQGSIQIKKRGFYFLSFCHFAFVILDES